jgi:hypothetical protein
MRRTVRLVGQWRPRKGTAIAGVLLAVLAAGVGWAATRAVNAGVITACVDQAGPGTMMLSSSGSCAAGQTTVQWNQQGPQGQPGLEGPPGQLGPQGPPGAAANNGGVVAWGPSAYKTGFTISTEIDKPGAYVADGSVDVVIKPDPLHPHPATAACGLLTGPPNGTATSVASWKQAFVYHKKTKSYTPSGLSGPVDINAGLSLGATDVPLEVYFSCHSLFSVWSHPTITIEAATSTAFHTRVGAALPVAPVIGPGPIGRVIGTH